MFPEIQWFETNVSHWVAVGNSQHIWQNMQANQKTRNQLLLNKLMKMTNILIGCVTITKCVTVTVVDATSN